MTTIGVFGLDPINLELLHAIRGGEKIQYVELLSYEEVVRPPTRRFDFEDLLGMAETAARAVKGGISGAIAYWDFPSSALLPVLLARLALPGAGPRAVARCEHKYWSRLEQSAVAPAVVPGFCAVDPFSDDPFSQIDIGFPFWLKPVKAHSSHLGFKIHNRAEFDEATTVIRDNIATFAEPFNAFLARIDLPAEVAAIDGYHCIAEEIISAGLQCTLEGYVFGADVVVYGVVDSIRSGKHRSCFARYQYPSRVPAGVKQRMSDVAARVLSHVGYDNAPFNMEFYWDHRMDEIRLLEINTRISKSHSPLFELVDGVSNHQVAVDLALGRRPEMTFREGRFPVAGKFMHRVFEDGFLMRMPRPDEIARVVDRFPEARIRLMAEEGTHLRHMHFQDSYSYELAEIFLGAKDQRSLLQKYRACLDMLPFEVEPEAADAA